MRQLQSIFDVAPIVDDPFVGEPLYGAKKEVLLVDLFAGIGGFHYGVAAAAAKHQKSVRTIMVSELDPECRATYAKNHHPDKDVLYGDINAINLASFSSNLEADVVTAGFPCQPFSNSGAKKGLSDERGKFYFRIEEIIKFFNAKSFILENVPGIRTNGGGSYKTELSTSHSHMGKTMRFFEKNLLKLTDQYEIKWHEISSSDLGSPQVRKRVFIVGIRKDFIPKETELDLRKLPSFEPNAFIKVQIEDESDKSLVLNKQQEANIRKLMRDSIRRGVKPFGPTFHDGMRRVGKAYSCDGGNVGQAYHAYGLVPTLTKVWARFMPIYFPAPGEVPPSVHSPVIKINDLYGTGNLRKVSVAEAMLLQGFPKSFVSHENRQLAYQHAGNAVNAKVVREIASLLFNFIGNP